VKTLKTFSLEAGNWGEIILTVWDIPEGIYGIFIQDFDTEEQAYNWLEEKGYIKR